MRIVVLLCFAIPLLAKTDSDKKVSLTEKVACFVYNNPIPIAGVSCGLGICGASGMDWLITNRSIWRSLRKRLRNPSPPPEAPAPATAPAGGIMCESIGMQRPAPLSIDLVLPTPGNNLRPSNRIIDSMVAETARLHRENRSFLQVGLLIGSSVITASLLYLLYEHLTQKPLETEQSETC